MTSFHKPTVEEEGRNSSAQEQKHPEHKHTDPIKQSSDLAEEEQNASLMDLDQLPTSHIPARNTDRELMTSPPGPETPRGQKENRSPLARISRTPRLRKEMMPEKVERAEKKAVTLHRSQHFSVRTTIRPDRHPQTDPLRRPSGTTAILPKIMPHQKTRIAESETRLMPALTLPIGRSFRRDLFTVPTWLEAVAVVIGMLLSLVVHSYNMFNFPRYDLDEGTYMASAWSILQGDLTPYPYGYGHPPAGWMQITALMQMLGGIFTFGNAINTGRVIMLLYALSGTLLVYLIMRRLGANRLISWLALAMFALSPLSITYHRQVFLDNIGTFWLLLALYLIIVSNSRLQHIILSALAFGLAILSKEVFVVFIPAMIYAVWLHSTQFQRKFALVSFAYAVTALGSSWVLMAILKGELFPYAWGLPWDTHPHLSMLDTLVAQVQRGKVEGGLDSSFYNWIEADRILMISSFIAIAFNLVIGWWNRKNLLFALLAMSFWVLLLRGGVVFSFYFIPLIPLSAINIALALHVLINWLVRYLRAEMVGLLVVASLIGALIPYNILSASTAFTLRPTSIQVETLQWIRQHIPRNSFIVINAYLFADLQVSGGQGVGNGATYPYAHVYFNVATDPEIYDTILQNNWDRIDYIVADAVMIRDVNNDSTRYKIVKDALDNSIQVAQFETQDFNTKFGLQIYQVQHKLPSSQPLTHSGGGTGGAHQPVVMSQDSPIYVKEYQSFS